MNSKVHTGIPFQLFQRNCSAGNRTFSCILVALLLTFCSTLSASAQKITIAAKAEPITNVLREIRKQAGYAFIYDTDVMSKAHPVTLNVNQKDITEVLPVLFKDQPLEYKMNGKVISVMAKKDRAKDKQHPIKGYVVDSLGKPIQNVSVHIKGTNQQTSTDKQGAFSFSDVAEGARLQFSLVGYGFSEAPATSNEMIVALHQRTETLAEVNINVSTGYQKIPKERATGSFALIDNRQLNRRVSTSIIERLEGITTGMLFNGNPVGGNGTRSNISIRGTSTIFANDKPLIVLDNFEYNGDINNINPNDIESITVLKDAAAASIWGARSGNGVIVITTKKGTLRTAPTFNANANVTIGEKPDLFYSRGLGPADYIELERFLFSKNYYDSSLSNAQMPALTPAVELMLLNRSGKLSNADLETQLDALKVHDVRNDMLKYIYQNNVNQQYALNLSGGTNQQRYFVSGGYDRNISNLKGDKYERITLNASNTYNFLKDRLSLTTSVIYTGTKNTADGNAYVYFSDKQILYPYARLADEQGNALPIPKLRTLFTDTVGKGRLLDWLYRPIDEIRLADNTSNQTNYLLNIDARYKILKGLSAEVKYQYGRTVILDRNLRSQETYFTRDLINSFSTINQATGAVTRRVPLGSILDLSNATATTNNIRFQADYVNNWANRHELNAIAGYEIRDYATDRNYNRFYGYNDEFATQTDVDYLTFFPTIYGTTTRRIPANRFLSAASNRNISYYANASYSYLQKYTLSASARKDESNLFGVNTNQKGVPLWSTGLKWDIKKEKFFEAPWMSQLQLRVTYGYNGNVDQSVTAYLTGSSLPDNGMGKPYTTITNPPNINLRWEKIRVMNLGIDFALLKERVSTSIEFYNKKGTDIMGDASLAPSAGLPTFRGNTANIKGNGWDITLNSLNTTGIVKWGTMLLFSNAKTSVSKYLKKITVVSDYVTGGIRNPIEGRPLFAVYSYRWAGLSNTGEPQGYLDGITSTAYSNIANSTNLDNMVYHGPANPTTFGSLMNTISWKQLSLSFNLIYKFGYYFKRPSLNSYALINGLFSLGDIEYTQRWQKPGDEKSTNVPALLYPTNQTRDDFYQNTEIVVEKGDHIRFQDLQLNYRIGKDVLRKLPVSSIEIYGYMNNVALLWKANKYGIDPDASGLPKPRSYAFGLKIGM
ncbi:SusC/RagA family TonB-linked outer membrane protein [Chitinophaga filiformis]|uniref:TonB-linked outer membrane protein, SusC/RagA family n=1 Tax=Chitinophaga filiformis TaxID=104663 RepID=A0A1G7MIY3_CHIFI|nr:SusC/RagA family TonB-linked outer membrane protein [Chitinophaga filiformis]SDF61671.1 TonB-linked outer membrane protein, SusC/RagA family [Chitinophaga filiformis]